MSFDVPLFYYSTQMYEVITQPVAKTIFKKTDSRCSVSTGVVSNVLIRSPAVSSQGSSDAPDRYSNIFCGSSHNPGNHQLF